MTITATLPKETSQYQQAAIKAGDWFLNTQVKDEFDANCGRYLYCRHLDSDKIQRSSGWQSGFGLMAILSLHRLTGKQKYLDSASVSRRLDQVPSNP